MQPSDLDDKMYSILHGAQRCSMSRTSLGGVGALHLAFYETALPLYLFEALAWQSVTLATLVVKSWQAKYNWRYRGQQQFQVPHLSHFQ